MIEESDDISGHCTHYLYIRKMRRLYIAHVYTVEPLYKGTPEIRTHI